LAHHSGRAATDWIGRPEALALLGVVLVLFAGLGARGLNEPDEGRYAATAREMAAGSDWLVPTLNGIPRLQKPPILHGLTAAGFRGLGESEWTARLPSALAALVTVVLMWAIGRPVFGRAPGLLRPWC
jgi:4-amino-4-deoxy-L-arabinose transferase-like glycosyltransferase